MKVEYWRWRYRDIETGRICRTMFQMSEAEARAQYVDAERIEGSMTLRDVADEAVVASGGAPGQESCHD